MSKPTGTEKVSREQADDLKLTAAIKIASALKGGKSK